MGARELLQAEAAKRILITDGAFGTEIQNWKLDEAAYAGDLDLSHDQKGNNDILVLTKPEVIASIHRAYFKAGADIAETNTFSANRISQADYGAEHLVREINVESARLARSIADEFAAKDGRPRFVAGALGPTNKTLSLSPEVNDPGYREIEFDFLMDVYREQIDALVEGGVDVILIETVFDTLTGKAAVMAAVEAARAQFESSQLSRAQFESAVRERSASALRELSLECAPPSARLDLWVAVARAELRRRWLRHRGRGAGRKLGAAQAERA